MMTLAHLQSVIQTGALLELAFIRHAPINPATRIQREHPDLRLSKAEFGAAGDLLIELVGVVLDAIGVKSWPVDIHADPHMVTTWSAPPPWLGESWKDTWAAVDRMRQSMQPDADPELQRAARSAHMVYGYTGGGLELWVSGLADADMEGVGEAGAALELEAVGAVDAWLRRRIAARTEADAVDLWKGLAIWRDAARTKRDLPPEERLAGWVRSTGSALRDSAPWVRRLCWVAGLVAAIQTRRGPPAVVPPVYREVFDARPRQGGLWLDDDDGQSRMQLGRNMVAVVNEHAMRALGIDKAQEAGPLWAVLGTVPVRRFFQHVIVECQQQQARGEDATVRIDGGYEGLRQRFGGKAEDWPSALKAGQHISLESPDGKEQWDGLWTVYTRRESTSTGQATYLEIEPGRLLKRGEVHHWPKGTGLVPVLRGDVPVHASIPPRIQAAVWRLRDAVVVHLVERWREARGEGLDMYPIERGYLERLAIEAGLKDPRVLWDLAFPGFIAGTDKAPAFIEAEVGRTAVEIRLADPHVAEREFIAQGVKERLNAAKAGQASGRKRRKK